MSVAAGVLVVVLWLLPIVLVAYLFRTLGTIVDGLRSINAGVERMAATLDRIEQRP
jgi:hypothetical protein